MKKKLFNGPYDSYLAEARGMVLAVVPVAVLVLLVQVQASAETSKDAFLAVTIVNSARSPAVGLDIPDLKISIRNRSFDFGNGGKVALLRGVFWQDDGQDPTRWLYRAPGESPGIKDIQSVLSRKDSFYLHVPIGPPSLAPFMCERGLILPGQSRQLVLPLTPQGQGACKLVVQYSVIGNRGSWKNEVFLPFEIKQIESQTSQTSKNPLNSAPMLKGECHTDFEFFLFSSRRKPASQPYSSEMSVVRSTAPFNAPALPITTQSFDLNLPVTAEMSAAQTGGLTFKQAESLAGVNGKSHKIWGYYRPQLDAWFFVGLDGKAIALRKIEQRWRKQAMPDMDHAAPRLFDELTEIYLRPEAFAGFGTGETHHGWRFGTMARPKEFFEILERARQRHIRIRRLVSSMGFRLSAGVNRDQIGYGCN
jgi:hypothetical protein